MNLIKEKELIKRWAHENDSRAIFPGWDESANSYFTDSSPIYIMEYGFENAPDLEQAFSDVWVRQPNDLIKKIIALSAIKNMPADDFAPPPRQYRL